MELTVAISVQNNAKTAIPHGQCDTGCDAGWTGAMCEQGK